MENGRKKFIIWPVITFAVAVIILGIISTNYFSFLETQLFEERKNYIEEFTGKTAEIMDGVISSSWQQLLACEHIIDIEEITSQDQLFDVLASTSDFIDENSSLVIAIDKSADYYSSDGETGSWSYKEHLEIETDKMR